MKKVKQNSAITLIALVITIIVLLILAAVTLNIVLGENGIFSKARNAKEETEYSTALEEINLIILQAQTEAASDGRTANLKDVIEELKKDSRYEYIINKEKLGRLSQNGYYTSTEGFDAEPVEKIYVIHKGYEFEIGKNLKITEPENKIFHGETNQGNQSQAIANNITGTNIEKAYEYNVDDVKLKGFFSNTNSNTKVKYNNTEITSTKNLPVGRWYLKYNSDTNEIEVLSKENIYIDDLSGNNRNLYLRNGTDVEVDSNGKNYLSFDGIDDYAQINELEETINWADGFTIEFEAEWNEFNSYSRIFDFANGAQNNNILIANYDTTDNLLFMLLNGSNQNDTSLKKSTINKNNVGKYIIKYEKNSSNSFNIKFLKENEEIYSITTSFTVQNIKRISNYLGKSNWSNDGYFKGKIYSLKITQADETQVLYYDINNSIKAINIVGNNYNEKVEDLSGNNRNLYLKDGAKINKDSNNKYYLSFDGINDYGQISELEETINWADGFTIEFEVEWNEFNFWSRIFDFANGAPSNNILIGNYDTTNNLIFMIINGTNQNEHNFKTSTITKDILEKYIIKYEKNNSNTFNIKFIKSNEEIFSTATSFTVQNIKRISNYIGKSNWSDNGYFKGKIYSLKITQADGTQILWYDINKWLELSK